MPGKNKMTEQESVSLTKPRCRQTGEKTFSKNKKEFLVN
jgi:hypothetical protein